MVMSRIAALALLASVGWTTAGSAQGASPQGGSPWVSWDAASRTVTFTLEAGAPASSGGPASSGPFNFDGYSNGAATLVVPTQSTVVMNFINHDGTPHSAELIPDQDPMPNMGGDPAIPTAYTKDVTQGLPQGGTDVMRFTAPASGTYRIFCGVPGHGLSGMWIRFKADPAARSPSLVAG